MRDAIVMFGVAKLSDLPTATLKAIVRPDHALNRDRPGAANQLAATPSHDWPAASTRDRV
jgi:hypothetical protein